jgi:hypothetical protein
MCLILSSIKLIEFNLLIISGVDGTISKFYILYNFV